MRKSTESFRKLLREIVGGNIRELRKCVKINIG